MIKKLAWSIYLFAVMGYMMMDPKYGPIIAAFSFLGWMVFGVALTVGRAEIKD